MVTIYTTRCNTKRSSCFLHSIYLLHTILATSPDYIPNRINRSLLVRGNAFVLCDVRTQFLYVIQWNFSLLTFKNIQNTCGTVLLSQDALNKLRNVSLSFERIFFICLNKCFPQIFLAKTSFVVQKGKKHSHYLSLRMSRYRRQRNNC